MNNFFVEMLLAFGGYIFHLLKQWYEMTKRSEQLLTKPFAILVAMNLLAIPLLVYIGRTLPSDLLVMSPLTCVIIGNFGSSMLSGIINSKKPKEVTETA